MKHNFGAGPCILPQNVFKEAAAGVLDFNGLSILEISHRSPDFVAVMEEAQDLVKKALNVPEGYSVLFLQGGATLGFTIAALNMMRDNKKAGYIHTGTWAKGAIGEAKAVGIDVNVFASSEDQNFSYIPKGWTAPEDVDYIHYTSNNTIFGTQFQDIPEVNAPLVCDMSSDIFSKSVDVSKFDLIYAGAQKNMGPAGATLVVVKEDILGKVSRKIPSMLDYSVHAGKDSMFNTPPVFAVYVSMLTMQWLKDMGGIPAIEEINEKKANLIYSEIELNPVFSGFAAKEDRSVMNATFNITDETLKDIFDEKCKEAGISGINGHRSVGGYRASMYNALSLESVGVLVDIMSELEKKG